MTRFGGAQLPVCVAQAGFAWMSAANVSTSGYLMLTIANANLVAKFGTDEQIETYVKPMLAGRFTGTMALSETQAGSSLADITTRAEPQADGSYRLFGVEDVDLGRRARDVGQHRQPGAGEDSRRSARARRASRCSSCRSSGRRATGRVGERNDVALAGLNHKMGQRGITNTVLNFGDGTFKPGGEAGAVGYLVGEPHRGLTYMFHMMNEARLGVGMAAVSLGYTGYLKSLQYARERPQGRPVTAKDPSAPRRSRSSSMPTSSGCCWRRRAYVEGGLALALYCARLIDLQHGPESAEEAERATLAARHPHPGGQELAVAVVPGGQRAWRSRCTAATATPASTTSSSTTATTGSTRSTRAPTASRASTCWAAR